jgi:hypothetical protein
MPKLFDARPLRVFVWLPIGKFCSGSPDAEAIRLPKKPSPLEGAFGAPSDTVLKVKQKVDNSGHKGVLI